MSGLKATESYGVKGAGLPNEGGSSRRDWRGLLPWEKTLTCPYDASHQVQPHRIGNHIWKCKKRVIKEDPKNPKLEPTPCPNYNCPVILCKAELALHLTRCKY